MVYATFEFYKNVYMGKAIPEHDFYRLALRASRYLDKMTLKYAAEHADDDAVMMAVCAVAEAWNVNEQGGDVSSQSVGPWSKTFQKEVKTDDRRLLDAARLYLPIEMTNVRWA